MTTFTIGGEAISVSLKVYARIKRAWKYISAIQSGADPYVANDAIIGVIAVGADAPFPGEPVSGGKDAIEAWRIEYIGDNLTVEEIKRLPDLMSALLVEAGLSLAPTEAPAADSPETALAA